MIRAKAIRIREPGGVEVLQLDQIDVSEPGGSEVLVEIHAAGLNRADLLQRRGLYPAPPGYAQDIPGLEYAGVVRQTGPRVRDYKAGDRVMGIVAGGSMSTAILVQERELIPVPKAFSLTEAAAIPEVFLTVYDALVIQGRLSAGQRVLIHSVASGVGTAALQLALVTGAQVIGTSRSQRKIALCSALGLEQAILVNDGKFADELREKTSGQMVQLILDTVGGAYLRENVEAIAPGGRIVIIGLLGGAKAELNLGLLLAKRASVHGSVLRSRTFEEKATLTQRFIRDGLSLFERGMLKPVIDCVMPMSEIQQAHLKMEQNLNCGKIVLEW
jgi:NADPH2:quinone reductase